MITIQNILDVDLVNDIFIKRDVNIILSIHLRQTNTDSWYLNKENMGQYTVKSAYAIIQENITEPFQWQFKLLEETIKFKSPSKSKNNSFERLTGCLPTKDHLLARRVAVNIEPPVCNADSESVMHTLVLCPFTGLCWSQIGYYKDAQISHIGWMWHFRNIHGRQ